MRKITTKILAVFLLLLLGSANAVFAATPGSMTVSTSEVVYGTNDNVIINWTKSSNAEWYGLSVRHSPFEGDRDLVFNDSVKGLSKNIGKLSAGQYQVKMKPYNKASKLGGPVTKPKYFMVVAPASSPKPVTIKTPVDDYPYRNKCVMIGDLVKSGTLPPQDKNKNGTSKYPDYYSEYGADGNGGDGKGYGCQQCASFVAWRVYQETNKYPNWGDAPSFPSKARADGYATGNTPKVGSIGVKGNHVVWVSSVNANGTINIEQYNKFIPNTNPGSGWGLYSYEQNLPASSFDTYIYIKK